MTLYKINPLRIEKIPLTIKNYPWPCGQGYFSYFKITETVKEKGQKLKICAKKARAANKRRVAFLAKIATR